MIILWERATHSGFRTCSMHGCIFSYSDANADLSHRWEHI